MNAGDVTSGYLKELFTRFSSDNDAEVVAAVREFSRLLALVGMTAEDVAGLIVELSEEKAKS